MALNTQKLADDLEAVLKQGFGDDPVSEEAAKAIKKTAAGMAKAIEGFVANVEIKGIAVDVTADPGSGALSGTQRDPVKPQ